MKVVHTARRFIFGFALALVPLPSLAITVTQPYPILPHTTASASQVQADFGALYSTVNGYLDASNFASGQGVYASQIVPTNTSNATFGGSQTYTFPQAIHVNQPSLFSGLLTTNGIYDAGTTQGISTLGNISFGGSGVGGTLYGNNGNINHTGNLNTGGNANITGGASIGGSVLVGGGVTTSGLVNNAPSTLNGPINGKTNNVAAQVLPVDINGSTFTGGANAHIEAFTVGSTGANFPGSFPKSFDATPVCTISSNATNGYSPSITPNSATSYSTGNTVSGTLYNIVCFGS